MVYPISAPTDIPGPPDGEDSRYRAGIEFFNRGEYFEAHEVWEELWRDCPAADRRFYQALIQAAVSIYHAQRGNRAGADRLCRSGKRYMGPYRPFYRGLEVARFWDEVEAFLAGLFCTGGAAGAAPPVIALTKSS